MREIAMGMKDTSWQWTGKSMCAGEGMDHIRYEWPTNFHGIYVGQISTAGSKTFFFIVVIEECQAIISCLMRFLVTHHELDASQDSLHDPKVKTPCPAPLVKLII